MNKLPRRSTYNWNLENISSSLTRKRRRKPNAGKKRWVEFIPKSAALALICLRIKQEEVTEKRRAERAEAFVPPREDAVPTVEEKKKRKRKATVEGEVEGEKPHKSKKKRVTEDS